MEQELFELLAKRSKRNFEGYENNKPAPTLEIPGELAFFLDDLLETAAKRLGRSEQDTFADIIERGVTSWYLSLDPQVMQDLGIGKLNTAAAQPAEATPPPKETKTPKPQYDEDGDQDDPDPATAQRLADSYAMDNTAYGYTPLTLHAIGNGNGNSKGGQSNNGRRGGSAGQNQGPSNKPKSKSRNRNRRRKSGSMGGPRGGSN